MMEPPPSGRAMLWHPGNMLVEHRGGRPEVRPSAWIASTAVLGGDVRVGAEARAMPRQGASLGAHRGDRIL